jgi:hypothetical protein
MLHQTFETSMLNQHVFANLVKLFHDGIFHKNGKVSLLRPDAGKKVGRVDLSVECRPT